MEGLGRIFVDEHQKLSGKRKILPKRRILAMT
jgi:hypothetical protein